MCQSPRLYEHRAVRRWRGLLFYRLLEQAVVTDPVIDCDLVVNPRPTGREQPSCHVPVGS
jgi:hypothetical protein